MLSTYTLPFFLYITKQLNKKFNNYQSLKEAGWNSKPIMIKQ